MHTVKTTKIARVGPVLTSCGITDVQKKKEKKSAHVGPAHTKYAGYKNGPCTYHMTMDFESHALYADSRVKTEVYFGLLRKRITPTWWPPC